MKFSEIITGIKLVSEAVSSYKQEQKTIRLISVKEGRLFLHQTLLKHYMKSSMPTEMFSQISDICIEKNHIRVVHTILGVLIFTPKTIKFSSDSTVLNYDLTVQDKVEKRNRSLLASFSMALVGAVVVTASSGLLGYSIIGAALAYGAKTSLETTEYVGINKNYYLAPLKNVLPSEQLNQSPLIAVLMDKPILLACDAPHLIVEIPEAIQPYLALIERNAIEFIKRDF